MQRFNPDKYYLACAFLYSQMEEHDYTLDDMRAIIKDRMAPGVLYDSGYSGAGHICVTVEFDSAIEAEAHIETCYKIAEELNTTISNMEINRTIKSIWDE